MNEHLAFTERKTNGLKESIFINQIGGSFRFKEISRKCENVNLYLENADLNKCGEYRKNRQRNGKIYIHK